MRIALFDMDKNLVVFSSTGAGPLVAHHAKGVGPLVAHHAKGVGPLVAHHAKGVGPLVAHHAKGVGPLVAHAKGVGPFQSSVYILSLMQLCCVAYTMWLCLQSSGMTDPTS